MSRVNARVHVRVNVRVSVRALIWVRVRQHGLRVALSMLTQGAEGCGQNVIVEEDIEAVSEARGGV